MRLAIAIFSVLAFAFAPGFADEPRSKTKSVDYASKDGRYSVTFPGTPKEEKSKVEVGGSDVIIVRQGVDLGDVYYTVAYNDYKPGVLDPDPKKVLEGVRNGNIGEGQLLTEDEKRTTFGPKKLPMREFTFVKDKLYFRNLIILDGDRLYQVMIVATSEKALTTPEAKKMYESFKLVTKE